MTTALVVSASIIGLGLLAAAFALYDVANAIRAIGHDRRQPKVTETYGSGLRMQ